MQSCVGVDRRGAGHRLGLEGYKSSVKRVLLSFRSFSFLAAWCQEVSSRGCVVCVIFYFIVCGHVVCRTCVVVRT